MKKFFAFILYTWSALGFANGGVRDGVSVARRGDAPTQSRVATTSRGTVDRSATPTVSGSSRGASGVVSRAAISTGTTSRGMSSMSRISTQTTTGRSAVTNGTAARSAIDQTSSAMSQTRTGAAYEKCKNAYFSCMDQFCQLKNDDYRRCSCSDRVYDLDETRNVILAAGEKLTTFTENLDVVGMTKAQATAMRTASEGEDALTTDNSASKSLLTAIMNSIKGEDTNVGGKYADLNTINLSFDAAQSFGDMDAGATIATYNGANLYNAVYPQCRELVKSECNDASLQRAITAYLMAVEQDCNTVQTAIGQKQKTMKAAVREGSAMLDLARVENRKKHNANDVTTCLANVEMAVLSDQVCGPGYRKCLDNGEFIDVSTGAPISGVSNFNELEKMLTFADGVDALDQKLSKVGANKTFVQNFESRVKKFAQPELDKCTEQADFVWSEYLDKALLDIYYAQQAKVSEIKQGCFDFVAACYLNAEKSMTAAMAEITGDKTLVLQPNKIELTADMCTDYVDSCNNMFGENIVQDYIKNRNDNDKLTACRAVVRQCFDNFGGSGYENLYNPNRGLFTRSEALNWFTLYDYNKEGNLVENSKNISVCAKQLQEIEACSDRDIYEKAFGGFDRMKQENKDAQYGLVNDANMLPGQIRSGGVATEVYNNILSILNTQCQALNGRFMTKNMIEQSNSYSFQYINQLNDQSEPLCYASFDYNQDGTPKSGYYGLVNYYGVKNTKFTDNGVKKIDAYGENMCPKGHADTVDTRSWGACLCWENGGRRSRDGASVKCESVLPVIAEEANKEATDGIFKEACITQNPSNNTSRWEYTAVYPWNDPNQTLHWCTMTIPNNYDQVCTFVSIKDDNTTMMQETVGMENGACPSGGQRFLDSLPKGLNATRSNKISSN